MGSAGSFVYCAGPVRKPLSPAATLLRLPTLQHSVCDPLRPLLWPSALSRYHDTTGAQRCQQPGSPSLGKGLGCHQAADACSPAGARTQRRPSTNSGRLSMHPLPSEGKWACAMTRHYSARPANGPPARHGSHATCSYPPRLWAPDLAIRGQRQARSLAQLESANRPHWPPQRCGPGLACSPRTPDPAILLTPQSQPAATLAAASTPMQRD